MAVITLKMGNNGPIWSAIDLFKKKPIYKVHEKQKNKKQACIVLIFIRKRIICRSSWTISRMTMDDIEDQGKGRLGLLKWTSELQFKTPLRRALERVHHGWLRTTDGRTPKGTLFKTGIVRIKMPGIWRQQDADKTDFRVGFVIFAFRI
jgi:hypothetical protein